MPVQQFMRPFVAAVPLHHVVVEEEVGPSHRNDEHQFAEAIEMLGADEVTHILHRGADDDQHHGDRPHTRMQRAHHEVRAEDG